MMTTTKFKVPDDRMSSRDEELERRLAAAEERVIRAAVTLIRRANAADTVRKIVLRAAEDVSHQNGDKPILEAVPFWDELSNSAKYRVGKMLDDE